MLKIGEKIKELRKAQGVTQEKLAEYLHISYQAGNVKSYAQN